MDDVFLKTIQEIGKQLKKINDKLDSLELEVVNMKLFFNSLSDE